MLKLLFHIGQYFLLISKALKRPEKGAVFRIRVMEEIDDLGTNSVGIVAIVSIFMGAVLTIQTAINITSPWIPIYTVGLATRDSLILEFSPTIISIILAGKVGSSIASEIGNMKISDQIDALEMMGVNSSAYLILPKIIAAVISNPFIVLLSMFLGMIGGWLGGNLTGECSSYDYIYGIQYAFTPFYITYALIKTMVFAFIITTVSSYQGYYTGRGSRDVGRSSTRAVVSSIIVILIFNFILTQMLLA